MLRRHIGNQSAAGVGGFVIEPHLRAHDHVAIEQATDAHQHDGAVRRDVAKLVGRPFFGGDHPARRSVLKLDLPATLHQRLADAAGGQLGRLDQRALGAMAKCLEALFANVFLELVQVKQNFWRVAGDAQGGRGDQKSQNQQKPPGAIDRIQAHQAEHLRPKRSKLIHIVAQRLMLLEHGADD